MKPPSSGIVAAGVIGVSALALITVGMSSSRKAPSPISRTDEAPSPRSVSAAGFTLASTQVDLPVDEATFPDAPHADIVNATCTACHSASMALTQPALSADQWKAIVTKMREVYHAPVTEADVPAIVAYLTSMPGQKAAPATAAAPASDRQRAADEAGGPG